MKYNIRGADQDTGEDIELTVEATDEEAAKDYAHRKGIMVTAVSRGLVKAEPEVHTRRIPATSPVETGHYQNAPIVNVAVPRRGSSLGVAAIIMGILAFLICWIPIVNLVGVPLSVLGVILGSIGIIVALTRNGSSIGYPIAGTAISGIALFITISMTGAMMTGLKNASDGYLEEAQRRNETNQTVVPPVAASNDSSDSLSDLGSDDSTLGAPSRTPPRTPPEDNSLPPSSPSIEWVSAENLVRQGDIQFQIVSALVGHVEVKDSYGDGTSNSVDTLLSIKVKMTNMGDTKKINYRSWHEDTIVFGDRMSLVDNYENSYKRINFGFGNEVVGSTDSESIYPSKSIYDVLVFEEPIGKAEFLNLELPASNFGGDGMLRIQIPSSMLQFE